MNQQIYDRLLRIGEQLAAQRDISRLLETIVSEAMAITNCDGGTLYLYEENLLHFMIMRTSSMGVARGGGGESIELPPVEVAEQNICAYALIHRELENIPDVYCSQKFDFSGPRQYDALTGYHTQSMLVIPLEDNKGNHVGVLQLINAMDTAGAVIPFDRAFEWIFRSVAAQAAIAVTNMRYTQEIEALFHSFVEVLTTAIDERSHYNANHTRNVAHLTNDFIAFINERHAAGETAYFISDALCREVVMAAWLHDVGKIVTPLQIMDKATKLGGMEQTTALRLEKIYYMEKTRYLSGEMTAEEWQALAQELAELRALCQRINRETPDEREIERLKGWSGRVTEVDGERVLWLSEQEIQALSIRYGTLTPEEREIMKDHVVITGRLLSKIKFNREFAHVAAIAGSHHERPNGHGYPLGISGDQIPLGARILQIMDIYEALTASDRPYKKQLQTAQALQVLSDMPDGDVDGELLRLLRLRYDPAG